MENTKQRSITLGEIILGAGALLFVLAVGWIIRYKAAFSTELIPGINGAYYPLQVRSILSGDGLGIPDFPLLFYFDSIIALMLSIFMTQDSAIVLATRLVDLLVPVLVAVPVMLFAYEFSKDQEQKIRAAAATLLVGLVAVSNTSLLRMAGDFQKNAAALPFSLMFLYFLFRSFKRQEWFDYLLAAVFFTITCLTHLGVTALTLTAAGFYMIITLAMHPNRKKALIIAGSLLLIAVITLAAVYLLDPTRIERLVGVILDPDSLFLSADQSDSGGSILDKIDFLEERLLLGNLLGAGGVVMLIIFRKEIDPQTKTLLWAASLTALLFASPLISPAWSQRLALMAFIPGLIPLTYLAVTKDWGWAATGILAAGVIWVTLSSPGVFAKKTLTTEAYQELEEITEYLDDGETLVFAAHGLEWWTAWIMDTEITNRYYLAAEAWEDYDGVYILTQTDPNAFSSGGRVLTAADADSQTRQVEQGQNTGTTQLFVGEYFTLNRMDEQPILRRGSGEPAIEGEVEEILDGALIVDGEVVIIGEDTVISLGAREITVDQLETGSRVIVWGEWQGIFNRQLEASYLNLVIQNPGRPTQQQPSSQQPSSQQPTTPQQISSTPSAEVEETVQLGPLTMVTRAGWGALPLNLHARSETGWFDAETNPTGVLRYTQPLSDWLTTIVVHHSALPVEQGPAEIQELHMNKSGYADIGYHFIIGADGTLYEGRPIVLRGAHTEGFNTGTVGVVLLGNFENGDPTEAQLRTLNQLIIFLRNRYGITHLAGHRDFNPEITVCPGETLAALLPQIALQTGLTYGTGGYQPPDWTAP